MNLYASRQEPTIVCDACGSRFRAARGSCPRCGAARVRPDPGQEQAPQGRRKEAVAAAGLASAALVASLLAWPSSSGDATSARASLLSTGSSFARSSARARPGRVELSADGTSGAGRPAFLDAKGAATLAYAEGRVDEALAQFEDVLAEQPDDPEALNNVGQVLVRIGRASEALPYLERAVNRFPDRWDFQFNYARALGESGRWSDAVERYRGAATLRPDDDVTTFNLARALERAGQSSEAIAGYERAVQLAPNDPSFHLALALARERSGDLAAARDAYEGYLALLPDGGQAQRVMVHIEALEARVQEATGAPGSK